ncbi:hypothetical protein ABEG17_14325 [Pedococcus sp. KACC 23699]|uniref:Uncharacterized protein n=1 Tax=Pedococcus sp. KACC 23699 TaxID=3149228 RepID=A0AAU7JQP2_9MICO
MTQASRRTVHGVVAVVTVAAVLWQLSLVVAGESVLAESAQPGLATRLARFISYFTILSNLLVALVGLAFVGADRALERRRRTSLA